MGFQILTSEKLSCPPWSSVWATFSATIGTVISVGFKKLGDDTCYPNQLYVVDEQHAFCENREREYGYCR
jgi:hypothetical protein